MNSDAVSVPIPYLFHLARMFNFLYMKQFVCRQNYVGLFGWSMAKNRKNIVLTSTEADAMAVYQATGMAAIALPRGISTLPQQVGITLINCIITN